MICPYFPCGGFPSHGGTPKSFYFWIFHEINHRAIGVYPIVRKPSCHKPTTTCRLQYKSNFIHWCVYIHIYIYILLEHIYIYTHPFIDEVCTLFTATTTSHRGSDLHQVLIWCKARRLSIASEPAELTWGKPKDSSGFQLSEPRKMPWVGGR